MARFRSLTDLADEVRQRADIENSEFITESELTRYINQSIARLYDKIVQASEDDFVTSTAIGLINGQEEYDLPEDFYKLRAIEMSVPGEPEPRTFRRWEFSERARYTSTASTETLPFVYRLVGNDKVRLLPIPSGVSITEITEGVHIALAANAEPGDGQIQVGSALDLPGPGNFFDFILSDGTYSVQLTGSQLPFDTDVIMTGSDVPPNTNNPPSMWWAAGSAYIAQIDIDVVSRQSVTVWYIPAAPQYDSEGDLEFDGRNGWEEWVVLDAAIKCRTKSEEDVSVLRAERDELWKDIAPGAQHKDVGAPARVQDVVGRRYDG